MISRYVTFLSICFRCLRKTSRLVYLLVKSYDCILINLGLYNPNFIRTLPDVSVIWIICELLVWCYEPVTHCLAVQSSSLNV